ncbi:hypothetical protein CDAR_109511 [Caerostris darwini]|uniref:Uncharacterized protein n=1 Tax=Caerostris darwini TaxID=1538125 RepID=A0AAV4TU20_9ARAC|nr:hypothetical protein CDAR_109511 [Caerostris darwini]
MLRSLHQFSITLPQVQLPQEADIESWCFFSSDFSTTTLKKNYLDSLHSVPLGRTETNLRELIFLEPYILPSIRNVVLMAFQSSEEEEGSANIFCFEVLI